MIKSVKKAMDILTILSESSETPISLKELSERTGLNKSTCAHIVDTMCDSWFVERISRKEGYRLGPWSYMLSRYGTYCQSLINTSAPIIKWLYKQTNAAVFISVLCNGRKYIIYHVAGDNVLPMSDSSMIQGHVEPTATGRLLMAYMDREALQYVIQKSAPDAPDAHIGAEMLRELEKIRQNGYAYVRVESERQQSYAFRIEKEGKVIAALGVLYSDVLESAEQSKRVVISGLSAAKEISRRLNFT